MREVNVAMAMILHVDEFILQQRKKGSANGAVGLIGAFGGQIQETDENSYVAAAREINEEIDLGFEVKGSDFRKLGMVHVQSDRDNKPILVNAEVFEILLPFEWPVRALEGKLKRMREDDVGKARARNKLTPATSAAFSKFYGI